MSISNHDADALREFLRERISHIVVVDKLEYPQLCRLFWIWQRVHLAENKIN